MWVYVRAIVWDRGAHMYYVISRAGTNIMYDPGLTDHVHQLEATGAAILMKQL